MVTESWSHPELSGSEHSLFDAAGFQRHLAKPVDAAELVDVVANLGRRALEDS